MKNEAISHLQLRRPVILDTRNTIKQAALAMASNEIGSVLISSPKGQIKGILTDRDLAMAIYRDDLLPADSLDVLTNSQLYSVTESASVSDVIQLMRDHGIRRVPVMRSSSNGKERCIGVLTLDDLVRLKLIDIDEEAEILRFQLKPSDNKSGRRRVRNLFHTQESRDQTYFRFLKLVKERTGLSSYEARALTLHVLGVLLQRFSKEIGRKMLAQLPHEIQIELMPQLSETDRHITIDLVIDELADRYNLSAMDAESLLQRFWSAFTEQLSEGEVQNILAQMPKSMRRSFGVEPVTLRR